MDCIFSIPKNYLDQAPVAGEPFQYQNMYCSDVVDGVQYFENQESGKYFYLYEHIDIGEIIIIFFLIFFLTFGALKIIWNYLQRGSIINKKL